MSFIKNISEEKSHQRKAKYSAPVNCTIDFLCHLLTQANIV